MKELPLGSNTAFVTSVGPPFHSNGDFHVVFHVEKFETLK